MNESKLESQQDKLFLLQWHEAEREIAFERYFYNLYVEHKRCFLKVHVRENGLHYRKCKYGCGQLVAIKRFQRYIIENSYTALPYYKRTHVIHSWYAAWELFDDLSPFRKHNCPKLRRALK